jgi:cell division transport system permease protein
VILARVGSGLRRTGRILVERPRAALWTLGALTCALLLAGVAWFAADRIDQWTAAPIAASRASMVVYLGEGVDDAHAEALVAQLAKLPGVEHAELVPAAESAKRLQSALGADSALLAGVEVGSLPPSVEVALQPGMRDVIAMSPTVAALKGTPGIDDVIVEDGGNDRVASSLSVVRGAAWGGAALLSVLALIIVLASTRVRMEKSAREQAVLQLLGASPWFTAVPTALAGALQGAVAAALAAVALAIGLAIYGGDVAGALHGILGNAALAAPAAAEVLVFIGFGAVLGLVGGGLAGASRATR